MSQITIAGDRVVVTSALTLENLMLVAKHRPDALCLKDADNNEIFRVGVGSNSISAKGVSYAKTTHDERRFATVTGVIPDGTEKAKEYVVDTYGLAIASLDRVEASLPDLIAEIEMDREELLGRIVTTATSQPPMSEE